MKQYRLLFTEQEWLQVESLIGEIPTKFGNPLINLLIPKLQEMKVPEEITTTEDPKPIGGGGGGAPRPPKSE